MKKFHWKLERVLDITAQREKALRSGLFALAQAVVRVRRAIVERRTVLRILLEEMGRRPLADRLAEQAVVMAYSAGEQRELRRLDARLAELEAERARKRERFLQTRSMRETLERMREQAREDYLRQVAKREQSEFDEQAHLAFARKAAPLAAAVLD